MLDSIRGRSDLLNLTPAQETELCEEIREFLIRHVAQTGGHLASNLGVVELTIALHKVYDTTTDRLLFDVGHQAYVHKILSGRQGQFTSLRTFGGISESSGGGNGGSSVIDEDNDGEYEENDIVTQQDASDIFDELEANND